MIKVISVCISIFNLTCLSLATAQPPNNPGVIPPPGSNLQLLAPASSLGDPASATPPEPIPTTRLQTPLDEYPANGHQLAEPAATIGPKPTLMWYDIAYWFGPEPWDIGFELGINGSDGQNETLSQRIGGHLKRETEFWKIDSSISYFQNTSNNIETQNNAKYDARFDRLLGESPWTLYFLTNVLYDEFQAFDLRFAMNAGLGYQIIDTEKVDLIGRFGAGASREFGGPDDRWAQEALFGIEYEHELTKTQRLSAKVDYFPEWKNFGNYRVVTDIGWEIDLDFPSNTSLKLSVLDRYDSTPNGVDPNNLNYALLLIWGL